ncbi:MAG: putative lipid II flippase FtsW [Verrucomicrobia bacterium]|nr:putative lipid II flippase FtsW [Verrucomicrobiota bacterium]MBI3867732.1 putative lipid II flippase FtsW [Verrucomicrobiota bacterium]
MKIATTLLVFCVAALAALGLVMITSACIGMESTKYLRNQAFWLAVGLAVCCGMALPDYKWLGRFAWVIYGGAIVLLALVFVPGLAPEIKGARRWIFLGGQSLQPSEFAKLALIIALARYGDKNHVHMRSFWRGVVAPGALVVAMLGLIFPEPDWGTTVLLACVSGVMLMVAGLRPVFFWPAVAAGFSALVIGIMHNSVRSTRVLAWLNPELYKDDKGYQAYQSLIALGSGGVTGVGLGEGRTKLGFMPEHHTDFIYSVIGEEMGLVATLAVLAAFFVIIVCGVVIAWNARDTFGLLLATGCTFLLGLQAFINIGVVTGTLPNKGLALPFLSYGGSNLLAMSATVGILLNVARHARANRPEGSFAGGDMNPFAEATV